jgi:TfoX N-terminal domain
MRRQTPTSGTSSSPRLRSSRILGVTPARYDEELADRIREVLSDLDVHGVREQKMFGGLAFLVGGHMAVAASREGGVLLSVDRAETDALLDKPHTRPMVMRGRDLEGWLRVDPEGLRTKRQLTSWVKRGVNHARSLPPK